MTRRRARPSAPARSSRRGPSTTSWGRSNAELYRADQGGEGRRHLGPGAGDRPGPGGPKPGPGRRPGPGPGQPLDSFRGDAKRTPAKEAPDLEMSKKDEHNPPTPKLQDGQGGHVPFWKDIAKSGKGKRLTDQNWLPKGKRRV